MTESTPRARGDAGQPVAGVPPWGTADGREFPRQRPAAPEPPVVPAWGTPPAETPRRRTPRQRTTAAWIVAGGLVVVGAITSTSESARPGGVGPGTARPAVVQPDAVQPAPGVPDAHVVQPAPLAIGICLKDLTPGAAGVPQVVACTKRHSAEVFLTTRLPVRGRYPGDLAVNAQVERLCKERLRRLVPSRPDLGLVGSAPRVGNWQIGKARVVCIAVLPHPAAGRFVPTD